MHRSITTVRGLSLATFWLMMQMTAAQAKEPSRPSSAQRAGRTCAGDTPMVRGRKGMQPCRRQ